MLILWSLMFSLFVGAAGFLYARIIEERVHSGGRAASADNGDGLVAPTGDRPVTFLLLGSDTRGEEDDPGRSDTIMVLRISPKEKIAYLLSIPRDTRVKIPGHGRTKINAAYQYGGAPLMAKTIKEFTGLEINHYAVIDFQGFEEVIDTLGGIDIDVEKRLLDRRHKIDIRPGYQHMDGEEALKYVRIRYSDDDFRRIGRQQKFLRAVIEKVMRVSSIIRIPQLADIASRNITTDNGLTITRMIAYGQMFKSIGRENLHTVTIPGAPQTIGGVSFVIADEPKMMWMVDRIKSDMPLELTEEEKENKNISIDVQNGSGKAGIARKMADKLGSLNFKIREVGNADSFTYYETQILASEEKADIAKKVQAQLGFGHVAVDESASGQVDVRVIVGRDFSSTLDNPEADGP